MCPARRRVNGEGTIYQRKDGRFEGSAYVWTTAGVRERRSVNGRTSEEAYKRLTALLYDSH